MRIAVSSKGDNLSSGVDPRFGRSSFFVVFDTEDGSFDVLNNEENAQAAQGAGVRSAENVVGRRVDVVVSGNIGPKAFDILSAAGIKVVTWEDGTVAQAVEMVKNDRLPSADSPNVEGHWR
jgi:predicted Fe-Mo cluster-binding NifX family protein